MQDNTNRKKIYLLIGGAIALVVFVIIVLLQSGSAQKLRLSQPFAANMAYPQQLAKDKVYFFTNSAFAIYDLRSKTTESLTPQYTLPNNITAVKIAKQGALIRANGYSPLDQLYPELVKANLDPALDYWWYIDFESDAISLVGSVANSYDVRGAAWQDDNNFVYAEKLAASAQLAIVSHSRSGTANAIASISDEAILVAATPKTVLYTEIDADVNSLKVLDIASKNATIVVQNVATILSTGPDGSALVVAESQTHAAENEASHDHEVPRGPLVLYDSTTKKSSEIASDFKGTAHWIPYNNTWGAIGREAAGESIGYTNTISNEVITFTIAEKKEERKTYHFVGAHDGSMLLADDSLAVYLLAAAPTNITSKQPPLDTLINGVFEDNFYVAHDPDLNQFTVYVLQNPYETNQQAATTHIKNLGYDINQLRIRWLPYDGVNPAFKLPDSVTSGYELEPGTPFDPEVGD